MEEDYKVILDGVRLNCLDKGYARNEAVDMVIRPEDIKFTSPENSPIHGEVISAVFKGVHYEMLIEIDGKEWLAHNTDLQPEGTKVGIVLDPDDIHIMKKGEQPMDIDPDLEEDNFEGDEGKGGDE